ncbi:MAG: hypothetical protein NTW85_00180 [Methylococcales bacterium]|nr:hypothetical protein [Methylococcales bacterium]
MIEKNGKPRGLSVKKMPLPPNLPTLGDMILIVARFDGYPRVKMMAT